MWSGDEVSDDDPQPGRVRRGDLDQRLDRAAFELVAPASTTVRTLSMPERRADVAGDGVGVDEQHALALAGPGGRTARLVATVVLPTPPFGLKTAMTVARRVQPSACRSPPWRIGPGAVVDGLAADAHRLDPPAQRLGRVGAGEVLVLDAARGPVGGQLVERARRDDHERRDGPAARAGARSTRATGRSRSRHRGSRRRRRGGCRAAPRARRGAGSVTAREAGLAQLGGDRGRLLGRAGR